MLCTVGRGGRAEALRELAFAQRVGDRAFSEDSQVAETYCIPGSIGDRFAQFHETALEW